MSATQKKAELRAMGEDALIFIFCFFTSQINILSILVDDAWT